MMRPPPAASGLSLLGPPLFFRRSRQGRGPSLPQAGARFSPLARPPLADSLRGARGPAGSGRQAAPPRRSNETDLAVPVAPDRLEAAPVLDPAAVGSPSASGHGLRGPGRVEATSAPCRLPGRKPPWRTDMRTAAGRYGRGMG
jgi:hypothetical protein